jgi:hypothetical protein
MVVVPLTVAVGLAMTVTWNVHRLVQPLPSRMLRVNVKIPALLPAVTVTDCALVAPTIVPLVEIDQP